MMERSRTAAVVLIAGALVIVGLIAVLSDRGEPRAGQKVALVCGVPKSVFEQPPRPLPDEKASREVRRDPSLRGATIPQLWRRYESGDKRVYVAGEPPSAHATTLERRNGEWKWSGGGGCDTIVQPVDRAAAVWAIPRGGIDPAAREFAVVVTDTQCADGRAADERVGNPVVRETPTSVTITFTATQLDGLHTCPGHANAQRLVRLKAPVGSRVLLDGGVFPPQPACVVGGPAPEPRYCDAFFYA